MAKNDTGVYEVRGRCQIAWFSTGKRKTKVLDIPFTQAGIRKAAKIRDQILRNEYLGIEDEPDKKQAPTFLEVAQTRIDALSANYKRNTLDALNNYWMMHFGGQRIDRIDHLQIIGKIANPLLKSDLKPKYMRSIVGAGSGVFKLAMKAGYVGSNPCAGITFAHQKEPVDPFTDAEMEALLELLNPTFRLFYLIRWYAGLRPGEVLALRWSDWSGNHLNVSKSRSRGSEGPTKTRMVREVYLHKRVVEALKNAPIHINCDYIIYTKQGKPYQKPQQMAEAFTAAQKALGLRWRHPYNVRHSCASRLLKAGIKPAFAAKQLGHSLEMFFEIYAKWIDVDETIRQEKIWETI